MQSVSSFASFQLLMGACYYTVDTTGLAEKTLLDIYPGGRANGWLCSLVKPTSAICVSMN